MKNGCDLLRDGHFYSGFAREGQERSGGAYTFGDHACAREDFAERAALAQLYAYLTITAQRARAGEH